MKENVIFVWDESVLEKSYKCKYCTFITHLECNERAITNKNKCVHCGHIYV